MWMGSSDLGKTPKTKGGTYEVNLKENCYYYMKYYLFLAELPILRVSEQVISYKFWQHLAPLHHLTVDCICLQL
jgi:hypothetical protein